MKRKCGVSFVCVCGSFPVGVLNAAASVEDAAVPICDSAAAGLLFVFYAKAFTYKSGLLCAHKRGDFRAAFRVCMLYEWISTGRRKSAKFGECVCGCGCR